MNNRPFSELLADNILDSVDALGLPTDGRLIALNSYENRVYQVGIEDAEPVIVKFYRPQRWSDKQIIEEHDFSIELAQADLPVVAPMRINGQSLNHIDGFRIAVFPRKGGRSPDLGRDEDLASLGRLMARVHNVGAGIRFEHRPEVSIESYFQRPQKNLLDNHIPPHLQEKFAQVFAAIAEQISHRQSEIPWPSTIRLHADAHPGNLLVRDDKIHMVDLDDCRSGPAVQDLFLFIGGDSVDERQGAWNALLSGYFEFRDFDYTQLQWVEVLRAMRYVHYLDWLSSRVGDPTFATAFADYDSDLFWNRWHGQLLEQQLKLMEGM